MKERKKENGAVTRVFWLPSCIQHRIIYSPFSSEFTCQISCQKNVQHKKVVITYFEFIFGRNKENNFFSKKTPTDVVVQK